MRLKCNDLLMCFFEHPLSPKQLIGTETIISSMGFDYLFVKCYYLAYNKLGIHEGFTPNPPTKAPQAVPHLPRPEFEQPQALTEGQGNRVAWHRAAPKRIADREYTN